MRFWFFKVAQIAWRAVIIFKLRAHFSQSRPRPKTSFQSSFKIRNAVNWTNDNNERPLKRQNRTYAKFDPIETHDRVIKAKWDLTKSPAQNLRNLGLVTLPNAGLNSRGRDEYAITTAYYGQTDDSDTNNNKFVDLYGTRKEETSPNLPMTIEDQKYMSRCFSKYGVDYTKMLRDVTVNDMQHTEYKVQKVGGKCIGLAEERRRVDVSDSIKNLVAW